MADSTARLILELIDHLTKPAKEAKAAIDNVSLAAGRARKSSADTRRGQDELNRSFVSTAQVARAATEAMTKVFLAYEGVKKIIAQPIAEGARLQRSIEDLQNTLGNIDPTKFGEITKMLRDLAEELPGTTQDFMAMARAAASLGIPTENIAGFREFIANAARMSKVFDQSGTDVIKTFTNLKNELQLTDSQLSLVVDSVVKMADRSGASAKDLLETLHTMGPLGRNLGFTAQQVMAIASQLGQVGQDSDEVRKSMRGLFDALQAGPSASAEQEKAFHMLGTTAMLFARDMRDPNIGPTAATEALFEAINKQAAGMGAAGNQWRALVEEGLFGTKGARSIDPLIRNVGKLHAEFDLVGHSANYAGAAQAKYDQRSKDAQGAIDRLVESFQEIRENVGEALLRPFQDLAAAIQPVLDVLVRLTREQPQIVGALAAIGVGLTTLSAGMSVIRLLGLATGLAGFGSAAAGAAPGVLALSSALRGLVLAWGAWEIGKSIGEPLGDWLRKTFGRLDMSLFGHGQIGTPATSPHFERSRSHPPVFFAGPGKGEIGPPMGAMPAPFTGQSPTLQKYREDMLKQLEGRATGGPVVKGQPYMVGEKGQPEVFIPGQSGNVSPIQPIYGSGGTREARVADLGPYTIIRRQGSGGGSIFDWFGGHGGPGAAAGAGGGGDYGGDFAGPTGGDGGAGPGFTGSGAAAFPKPGGGGGRRGRGGGRGMPAAGGGFGPRMQGGKGHVSSDFVMNKLMSLGWTKEEAAAGAGVSYFESGNRPGVVNAIGATGLYQMLSADRKRGMMKYAAATGRKWDDPNVQVEWWNMERTGESVKYGGSDERANFRRALSFPDVARKSVALEQYVQRPGAFSGAAVAAGARTAMRDWTPPATEAKREAAINLTGSASAKAGAPVTYNHSPTYNISGHSPEQVARAIDRHRQREQAAIEAAHRGAYADNGYTQ